MRPAGALLALALAVPQSMAPGEHLVRDRMVVIVNPASGVTHLTREEAKNIFMGRTRFLRPGLVALPVEQTSPESSRARFYELLVNLPLAEVRTYWARLYFSGQAQPPRQTANEEETLDVVAANVGAIGFVDPGKVDPRVKGVLVLEKPAP
jgi:ABC-type phosphate transport system substrate-binding protein